jgi:hypothetical protein
MKKTVITLALCLLCGINISAQITTDSTDIVISGRPTSLEFYDFPDEEITGPGIRAAYYDPNDTYNAFRMGIGYRGQYFTDKCSSALNLPTGFCGSIDISYRRFYFGINVGFEEGILGADNFHYDRREDYDWNKGENIKIAPVMVRSGFNIINRGPICMTAFFGLGGSTIQQDTGKKSGENEQPVYSKIKGTGSEIGLMARHTLYSFIYTRTSLEVTAGVSVSQNKYESIGTTYSVNGFLTFNMALGFR